MREINLSGLKVRLDDPIQVTEGVGHTWFPQLTRFTSGELLASTSAVADAHGLPIHAQRVYLSTDQGRTWEYRYTVSEAMLSIKIPRPNGDILSLGRVTPDPPGQWRNFIGNYIRYQAGGRRIQIEDGGMRVLGLPRDVRAMPPQHVLPGQVDHGQQTFDGNGLEIDGRLLTTMYLTFAGDDLYSVVLIASDDEGRTWRYLSTVAGPDAVPGVPEGPCEPNLAQLETGELMCIMRLGSGPDWHLARSYSQDGGRSWSPVDRLPAFSVEPSLKRLSNGVLVISSGRPGIYLWLSTDPRGASWQQIDIVVHHNAWAPDAGYTIIPERSGERAKRHGGDQTTAYTELVEISPNRLLLIYDRVPFGWNSVPLDSAQRSRIFVLPIEIERA